MKRFRCLLLVLLLAFQGLAQDALQLQCPPPQTNWACGETFLLVTYPPPTASGRCSGAPVITCQPSSGSGFILGTTTVTCTATNSCRESATCSFQVTVAPDNTPPTIEGPTNLVLWTSSTNGVEWAQAQPHVKVIDGGSGVASVDFTPPFGSVLPPGETRVTVAATDHCGNRSTYAFPVMVRLDTNAPVIVCPETFFAYTCDPNGMVLSYPLPITSDDANASPSVVCVPPSDSLFPQGVTRVFCTATDAAGNQSSCSFDVRVIQDVEPPVIEIPDDMGVEACDPRGTVVTWPTPEVTDNPIAYQVTCTPPSGSVFPVGVTTVTCDARDSCGNRLHVDRWHWQVIVTFESVRSAGGIDANTNGLADVWEIHFNAQGLAPGDDTDGDGASNLDESVMGTDPRNPSSVLAVELEPPQPAQVDYYLKIQTLDGDTTHLHKMLQIQFTAELGGPWVDLGEPVRGTVTGRITSIAVDPSDAGNAPYGFFRVKIFDLDEDLDGLTAWEESILGTSDATPASLGGWGNDWISGGTGQDGTNSSYGGGGLDVLIANTGYDRQFALDWITAHLGQTRLREVALAHIGGSPLGPMETKLVTATGTGGWLKLSSWTLDPATHDPKHLEDTAPFEGWNAKLEVLEPLQSPTLTLNPFVCGRIRNDENLWLTVRRVDADGKHGELSTLGYDPNANLRVYDYAMAHQPVSGSGIGAENFILVTPVMGLNTADQRELRVVTWLFNPNTGAINGVYDTSNLGHTNLPGIGGRLQIVREAMGRYVVSYLNQYSQLSSWLFDVDEHGAVFPRGGAATSLVLTLQGDRLDPAASPDFALGRLNAAGWVTLLAGTNCSTRFAAWEDRVVACDLACEAKPFYISDGTLRGSGRINTPTVTGFAVRCINDALAVGAVIYGTNTLRIDAWQVVADTGQVSSQNYSTLNVHGLQAGTYAPHVKMFDLTPLPTVGDADAEYVTGCLDGGQLRLNVWRVAAEPGF